MEEITKLTLEGIEKASISWANCVQHAIEGAENYMWKLDGIEEELVERVSFVVNNSSDDSEQYTDDNFSGIEPLEETQ